MKKTTKLTALLLAILFVCTTAFGCINDPTTQPPTETTTDNSSDVTTEPEIPPVDVIINAENAEQYTVIRADNAPTSLVTAIAEFRTKISTAIGKDISLKDDWIKNPADLPEKAKEIVVGSSTRADGDLIENELREKDFAIVYKNERIFIIGGSEEATLRAMDKFEELYLDTSNKQIKVNDQLDHYELYDYALGKIEIDGVSIRDYTVVIPKNADLSTKYAAENLSDFLIANAGFDMTITTDATAETKYEILIGDTNRQESKIELAAPCAESKYVFYKTNDKIVCLGESYMVGGGVGDLISRMPLDKVNAEVNITDIPSSATVSTFSFKDPKSAILLIGDGMGFNTIEMSLKKIGKFIGAELPNTGSAYTGSVNTQSNPTKPTDSAASGTALATGVKTKNGFIGVDKDNKKLKNLRELAAEKGANTGVITTDVITGATPGAFLVHHNDRKATSTIQSQIDSLLNAKSIDWCVGSIDNKLRTNTATALRTLASGNDSFFLMVEEGYIDKRSHNNEMDKCISMVERFNDEIAYVIQFVLCHPDTVMIITADHETGGITKNPDGSFKYTTTEHSTADVPVFAIGKGTEIFDDKKVDNTDIPKFIAKIYGENNFGK